MANKRIFLGIGVLLILAGAVGFFLIERNIPSTENKTELTERKTANIPAQTKQTIEKKDEIPVIKTALYANSPYYMPLFSIAEISGMTDKNKELVNNFFNDAQGFYFLKQSGNNGNYTILLQNPVNINYSMYPRHNLQLVKISADGNIKTEDLGYNGQINETVNAVSMEKDVWKFDKSVEPYRPLKHTEYENKDVVFTEIWNYDEKESVKYEMKNADGNVVSMVKEFIDNDMSYRIEHTFYDNEGRTLRSISINFEGANIKWFNYYDSTNPDDCILIESEYEEGLLKYEKIYNQEFKLLHKFEAKYSNGELIELIQYDNTDNIVKKFIG